MDNFKIIQNKTLDMNTNFNWHIFRKLYTDEIIQNEKLSHNLVQKILFSRRLLIDHVESLEHCVPLSNNKTESGLFTFSNTVLLSAATVIQRILIPKSLKFTIIPLSIATSGFCCLYLAKIFFKFRMKYIEKDLEKLINTIDKYGNCIKRNITYFNEILVNKSTDLIGPRHMERAWDCITSVKEIIDIIYEATRKLENNYELPIKFQEHYFPMEELKESDYFTRNITEYTHKNIKDFYNIFAYVQSQFLHRLAFTLLCNTSTEFFRQDIAEMELAIEQHIVEEDQYYYKLSVEIKRKQQLESNQFYKQFNQPIKSVPLALLRESSLKLCACIIGVAEECQKLDIILQKINTKNSLMHNIDKQHLEVANSVGAIEGSLSFCCEDFNRLMIIYNRYLDNKLSNKTTKNEITLNDSENCDTASESATTNMDQNNYDDDFEQIQDDFYAYCSDDLEETNKSKLNYSQQEADQTEQITKTKFKPVLQQLKITINPIREKMLERERQILQSKGIDVDKLLEQENKLIKTCEIKSYDDDYASIGSADDIDSELKIHKKDDKFEEMRKFLSEKQAMDIFGGSLPHNMKSLSEVILE